MLIQMTEEEHRIAKYIAGCRMASCKANHVTDKQMGKQSPDQIEYDGVLSEMAVAKVMNLYPDFTTQPRHGGVDLTDHDGTRIDVKSTRYDDVIMCVHKDKDPNEVDIYIMTRIKDKTVEVIGYLTSPDVFKDSNLRDLGHGLTYAIDAKDLKEFIL
jgi:hypothetical protein